MAGPPEKRAIEYVDIATGKVAHCNNAVTTSKAWPDGRMQNDAGQVNIVMPSLLHVAPHQRSATEYEYIVGSLRKVCRGSVETGNPIRWS
jgi:hypothetical protein